jgi:chromosome segregation protein
VHIDRLRLIGFKSFVEPTELVVERGLTGVVGPNGCGKSNLLEALRWVMGETSHKSMRAAAMDDVIFAGTNTRPPRNTAEVTIRIDNSARTAPAELNDADVLEVTRRIEREAGSAYRINGKEARARDIKLLFEDAATGARSPALVRQGQIGELVNAKPEQRRRILEDAAGVAGLHSRRHEAELRMKAAEANLARVDDIIGQLATQLESLKRQARQARRYREISEELRKLDAVRWHLVWTAAQAAVVEAEADHSAMLEAAAIATAAEADALQLEIETAEALQPLRDEEATRAAALHRMRVEIENFEREAQRAQQRQQELGERIAQLDRDLERERSLIDEAREMLSRLAAESEAIDKEAAVAKDFDRKLADALSAAEEAARIAEARLATSTQRLAEARAGRRAREQSLAERKAEVERTRRQLEGLVAQAREIAARAPDITKVTSAQETGARLAREVAEIEAAMAELEEQKEIAQDEARQRREAAQRASLAAGQLEAEVATLVKLLAPPREQDWPPIADQLTVTPGYEAALGAALGDDLEAPTDVAAPAHWSTLVSAAPDAELPVGTPSLAAHVAGAPELARRLAHTGVVARADGPRLQAMLAPGQRLVSREGDLWRWDGFVAGADAPSPAAQRLIERNRLGEVEAAARAARDGAAAATVAERAAAERLRTVEESERQLRQSWRETQTRLAQARETLTTAERAARETEAKLAAVNDARSHAEEVLEEAMERLAAAEDAIAVAPLLDALDEEQRTAQDEAAARRFDVSEARTEVSAFEREQRARVERQKAMIAERERWITRGEGAEKQIAALEARRAEAQGELDGLADLPERIAGQRQRLITRSEDLDRERRAAADRLAAADTAQRTATQALKDAQARSAATREARARSEVRLEGARTRRSEEMGKIREALGCAPDGCLALAGLAAGAALPTAADVERNLARLEADRQRLGGVNLQAEEELARVQEQHDHMAGERADVEQAIAKLRGGIGQLNREAKQRLNEAFRTVDGHFRHLFGVLFGGGEARLEMIESEEDPLEGGLEIIAKPPGKKPATLSLLSGGEQTLTALSLIFAVFLTNPSPICVLDEVDAPLDDSNVDRFSTMMERMAEETDTRFLVITHHPMTMSRMHRLFGVTMAEKGVSQLVSVDLQTAQSFVSAESEAA